MKDNQYNYCNFFLKKQQIIYSAKSEEPKAQCKRSAFFLVRIAKDAQCFSSQFCQTHRKYKQILTRVSALIISRYFLKETAFSTSFKSAPQTETLRHTKLKTDFFQSKTSINNWFYCRTRNVQQSNFSIHIHNTFDFFNTSPFFSIRTYSHPCRIPLAPLAAALTRTEHFTLLDLFLVQVVYRD